MTFQKRKNPRFLCSDPAEYPVDFTDIGQAGRLCDLSRDGLGFTSHRHLQADQICKFELWSSVLNKPISCQARILWVRFHDGTKDYVYGAQILKMDPSSKTDLLDILYRDWKKRVFENA